MLDGWDDDAHKYKEAQTGGLHTKERCQEAKLKLEQKNDHGNETVYDITPPPKQEYVDHTLKPKLKIKTFTDPTPEGLDLQVNAFIDTHNVRHGQYRPLGSLYSTQVWYEEKESK